MKSPSEKQQQENQLWHSLRRGDEKAFESLYDLHANALLSYGVRITNQKEIVNDALQDVFIHIWQKRDQLPIIKNGRAFLLTALRNRVIRILESRNLNTNSIQPNQAIQESFEQNIILEEIAEERLLKVYQTIHTLPTRQKEVIHLRYFQNLRTEEIAEVLNINYQSVSNLLYKGIQKMRKQLNNTTSRQKLRP